MNIAIVQFYSYHEEILSPQIEFLINHCNIFLAAPANVFENDYIKPYINLIHPILFKNHNYNKSKLKFILRIYSILKKYFILFLNNSKYKFDLIIFNTINKDFHYTIINCLFKNCKKIQIIHNSYNLNYNNFKLFCNNIFLSHNIYEKSKNEPKIINKHINFAWFCPLLPLNLIENYKSNKIFFDPSLINIVIPGTVEAERRNYSSLFSALKKYKSKNELKFKIYLAGKINENMISVINNYKINHIITYFTEFISGKDMLYSIKNCDAVAFLIDSKLGDNFKYYNNYKVSGTVNLCITFNKSCIVSDEYSIEAALKNHVVTYQNDNFLTIFEKIEDGIITKEYFEKLNSKPIDEMYSFAFQQKQYLKSIGLI